MEINSLTLFASQLQPLISFYHEVLGAKLHSKEKDAFTVEIGTTLLTFKKAEQRHYYHFAINIPSNQIEEAKDWLKGKVQILPFQGDEIVDFQDWNAKALYFYDPEGNIVEFIARRNLKISSFTPFSSVSFQHISEIGLPVSNVQSTYQILNRGCNLEKYSGDFDRFCAIGEETGLFITIDFEQKDWIPNEDPAIPFPLEMDFDHNQKSFNLVFRNEELMLS